MNKESLAAHAEKKIEMSSGNLKDFQLTHLAQFKNNGIKASPEAYKFTHLNSFFEALDHSPYEGEEVKLEDYLDSNFIDFIFIDGELKSPKPKISGLKISEISGSLNVLKEQNPLSSLHHSLLKDGIVFEVEKKIKLEKPLRLVHVITRSGVNALTTIIKAEAFSEFSVIEENYDQDLSHAFIGETYIEVQSGASLEHVQLSHGGNTSLLHSTTFTTIARDAKYRNVLLNLSGKLNRRNVKIELLETGAHAESYNLYLTNGSEHSDISTAIEHKAPDTTSNQIAKGILDGESKGIFTGLIHIHPQAQRVASGQLNKNLILSLKAQAHSQPQLEIFADDVKCSHGSTTGQLSPDEVFYFEARGIPADKAKTLLAYGFGLEIVLKIENKTSREKVETLVMNALKAKFHLGETL